MLSIEEMIFQKKHWRVEKMVSYGFQNVKNRYVYETPFLNGDFKAILSVTPDGNVQGQVIDEMNGEEYAQIRQKGACGEYVQEVRHSYEALLMQIAKACCDEKLFVSDQANRLARCMKEIYNVEPDFPWAKEKRYHSYGTFRHPRSGKWFALLMNVERKVLDKNQDHTMVDVINLKLDKKREEEIHQIPGVYPAYHMNHKTWISVILNETVSDETILALIKSSFEMTK